MLQRRTGFHVQMAYGGVEANAIALDSPSFLNRFEVFV
jgi:hypothetical protein